MVNDLDKRTALWAVKGGHIPRWSGDRLVSNTNIPNKSKHHKGERVVEPRLTVEAFFPDVFDRDSKIKVDVLACGDYYYLLGMKQGTIVRFVVKDFDNAWTFEDKGESLDFFSAKEAETSLKVRNYEDQIPQS